MPKLSSLFQYEHMKFTLDSKNAFSIGIFEGRILPRGVSSHRNVLFDKYLISKPHICGVMFLPHERFVGFETKYTH